MPASQPRHCGTDGPDTPPAPAIGPVIHHGLLWLLVGFGLAGRAGAEVDGEPQQERPPAAAAAPSGGGGAVGPLSTEEVLRRYDLDGDGTVDDVEAAIGQAKLRRYRKAVRAATEIDPVTGFPRSQSDPTTTSGRRVERPSPADGALPGQSRRDGGGYDHRSASSRDGVGFPRHAPPPSTPPAATGDGRSERILSVLTAPPRTSGAGQSAANPIPGRDRQANGSGRPEPFGWVPAGNGTLFRGGSYPLPDRGSRAGAAGSAGAGGNGKGSGALLQRGGTGTAPGRGPSVNPSRALVPPANRATGNTASGARGSGGRTSGPSSAAPSGR